MASNIGYKILIVALILVVFGAILWGWQGLFNNNIVDTINNATFKNQTWKRIFYVIVGIAGLYVIFSFGTFRECTKLLKKSVTGKDE